MSGIAWSIAAGVGFGVFQAVNRRANAHIDAYRATFTLLTISVVVLAPIAALTEDLSDISGAPLTAYAWFIAAGVIHFFGGWTFFALSQQRIGAGNSGVVLAATPLVATLLAALFLRERLPASTIIGVVLVTIGIGIIASRRMQSESMGSIPWHALAAAACWGSSPILIKFGLAQFNSPLIGVTLGLGSAAAIYGFLLLFSAPPKRGSFKDGTFWWLALAGVLVALAIGSQWQAFSVTDVAVAITLIQLSTPIVVFLAPVVVKAEAEKITPSLLIGMTVVIAGSMLVIWQN